MPPFKEIDVQRHLHKVGLGAVMENAESLLDAANPAFGSTTNEYDQPDFELWRLLKEKSIEKLRYSHNLVLSGEFIGSGINLPIDNTRHMFLDLIGYHEDGLFILELKVDKPAERNAFTEILGYSNYLSGLFPGIGSKDILNILVTPLSAKVAKQAYLYDLIISDRSVILYQPSFSANTAESLQLSLYIPDDDEFKHFANRLLSHDAMSCVVASFPDIPGWIDYDKDDPQRLPSYTRDALQRITSYTAQLMEKEGLHGFCYARKRWREIEMAISGEEQTAIIVCAINPFRLLDMNRIGLITDQLDEDDIPIFTQIPQMGFDGRLCKIVKRTIRDCIDAEYPSFLDIPSWSGIVTEMSETVFTDNIGFRSTGMLREAYVEQLAAIRRYNLKNPNNATDCERLQVDDIVNWLKAWVFMEGCGFTS